jgi:hypothetical protein
MSQLASTENGLEVLVQRVGIGTAARPVGQDLSPRLDRLIVDVSQPQHARRVQKEHADLQGPIRVAVAWLGYIQRGQRHLSSCDVKRIQ